MTSETLAKQSVADLGASLRACSVTSKETAMNSIGRRAQAAWIGLSALLALGACTTPPPRPAQIAPGDYNHARDWLDWRIRQAMQEQEIVGLSAALVDGEHLVWAEGFGLADRERGVAADADTLYRTGGLTKLVPATAAARGRLDLDRPVAEVLPGFVVRSRFPATQAITPRMLLTHHSGLPLDRLQGKWSDRPRFFTDLLALLPDTDLAAAPGTVLGYSNPGYSLLGHLIQARVEEPFAGYVQRVVLEPAGMQGASLSPYPPQGTAAYTAKRDRAQREYHRAYLIMSPGHRLGVVLLSNTDHAPGTLVEVGNRALELMWEAKTGDRVPSQRGLPSVPGPYREDVRALEGHYDTHYGFARARRDGEGLAVQLDGRPLRLEPLGEGHFAVQGRILRAIPAELERLALGLKRVGDRRLLLAAAPGESLAVVGERLDPLPIPPVWYRRLGDYRILDPEGSLREWSEKGRIRALERDGFLLVEVSSDGALEQVLALAPLSASEAVVRGLGSGRGGMVPAVQRGEGSC
jgi:CubicO group peptidase (beta-lactamase class C family)